MLNSIQNQTNARPAFGHSKCSYGKIMIKELVKEGANAKKAARYVDDISPLDGKMGAMSREERRAHLDSTQTLLGILDLKEIAKTLA